MRTIHEEGSRPIRLWTEDVEASAMQQLKNLATLPFIDQHGVAAMPDVHWGMGATVGSVIATSGAIIPAAVGVDIGCGMMATRLAGARQEHLPDSLAQIRSEIEHTVPTGFGQHRPGEQHRAGAEACILTSADALGSHLAEIQKRRKDPITTIIAYQLGTLGGGNHFIEVCIDEAGELWVMLHSGSRGIGNAIGQHFIELAKTEMRVHEVNLPDRDLAYLEEGTKHFDDYVKAVSWAQEYARANRVEMMRRILIVLHRHLPPFRDREEAVNCHHNYVERETHFGRQVWLTRKGAIRAGAGELGIIPGSMGQRSYIVRGRGNLDSYQSCSHGAGRRMSRGAARKTFTVADLEQQTVGVECRKDAAVLDEIPGSYKSIDEVMANQADLVQIVHTLKQVLCVKGA